MADCIYTLYPTASLRTLVLFEKPVRQPDGGGGFKEAGWEVVLQAWCAVSLVSDYKRFQHQQMEQQVTHKVVMRYRREIDTTMHAVIIQPNGKRDVYELVAADDVEMRHVWLVLKANGPVRDD